MFIKAVHFPMNISLVCIKYYEMWVNFNCSSMMIHTKLKAETTGKYHTPRNSLVALEIENSLFIGLHFVGPLHYKVLMWYIDNTQSTIFYALGFGSRIKKHGTLLL